MNQYTLTIVGGTAGVELLIKAASYDVTTDEGRVDIDFINEDGDTTTQVSVGAHQTYAIQLVE